MTHPRGLGSIQPPQNCLDVRDLHVDMRLRSVERPRGWGCAIGGNAFGREFSVSEHSFFAFVLRNPNGVTVHHLDVATSAFVPLRPVTVHEALRTDMKMIPTPQEIEDHLTATRTVAGVDMVVRIGILHGLIPHLLRKGSIRSIGIETDM